jgi:hypothetical protein
VTAQLTDLGEQKVEIGMPVEMVTRRIRLYIGTWDAGLWI